MRTSESTNTFPTEWSQNWKLIFEEYVVRLEWRFSYFLCTWENGRCCQVNSYMHMKNGWENQCSLVGYIINTKLVSEKYLCNEIVYYTTSVKWFMVKCVPLQNKAKPREANSREANSRTSCSIHIIMQILSKKIIIALCLLL